jgi:dTDP-4-amino-4,6-dideoxygalactose transaminase
LIPKVANHSIAPGAYLPLTDEFARREVTLPLYPGMSDDEVDFVVAAARSALVLTCN